MSAVDDSVDPSFLGFGAFETTALCTAVLVAFYSLIPNPTGRQTGSDQAEYEVYSGWRWAILPLVAQLILIPIVLVVQPTGVSTATKGWLVGLMLAPWAPLAGSIRNTLTSFARVRRMMKSRLTRNEIAAIVRDRFKFGQRGIALPVLIHRITGDLPKCTMAALQKEPRFDGHYDELREQAEEVSETEKNNALELGSCWVMTQSIQPDSVSRLQLAFMKYVGTVDPLVRLWTTREVELSVDPMPERAEDSLMQRARFLDVADILQQGGTISEELMQRSMKRFCNRCRLATRGAVEAFMESSERSHTDLRAKVWVKNINMDWRGPFERVINVMWEAAFMDGRSWKLDYAEDDQSNGYGDRSKVVTTKMMALLFLIVRSLMRTDREHLTYSHIADVVRVGPYSEEWWIRFWKKLADTIASRSSSFVPNMLPPGAIDARTRVDMKGTLRALIDDDMETIVSMLLENPIDHLCAQKTSSGEDCLLAKGKIMLMQCAEA